MFMLLQSKVATSIKFFLHLFSHRSHTVACRVAKKLKVDQDSSKCTKTESKEKVNCDKDSLFWCEGEESGVNADTVKSHFKVPPRF